MENNEIKKSKRVYKLKFDQLWVDAINQIPVCYHSEIYYWLDYYQNHNHSDLIGTIKDDLVRSLFMLIYPTIRRRRLAAPLSCAQEGCPPRCDGAASGSFAIRFRAE